MTTLCVFRGRTRTDTDGCVSCVHAKGFKSSLCLEGGVVAQLEERREEEKLQPERNRAETKFEAMGTVPRSSSGLFRLVWYSPCCVN